MVQADGCSRTGSVESSKDLSRGWTMACNQVWPTYEMMLPLVWEVRRRCDKFWVRLIRMEEKRIVRIMALEAWECQSMLNLGEDLKDSLEKFGWSSRVVLKLEGVLVGEVGYMLRDCTCHEVKKAWRMEAEGRLKVGMEKNLEDGCKARCVRVVVAETENSNTHRTPSREREYPSKPEIMTRQRTPAIGD